MAQVAETIEKLPLWSVRRRCAGRAARWMSKISVCAIPLSVFTASSDCYRSLQHHSWAFAPGTRTLALMSDVVGV